MSNIARTTVMSLVFASKQTWGITSTLGRATVNKQVSVCKDVTSARGIREVTMIHEQCLMLHLTSVLFFDLVLYFAIASDSLSEIIQLDCGYYQSRKEAFASVSLSHSLKDNIDFKKLAAHLYSIVGIESVDKVTSSFSMYSNSGITVVQIFNNLRLS